MVFFLQVGLCEALGEYFFSKRVPGTLTTVLAGITREMVILKDSFTSPDLTR